MIAILKEIKELLQGLLAARRPVREVMNTTEAAEYLRVSTKTIYDEKDTYKIPFVPMGGKLLFRKDSLDQWLKEREVHTPEKHRQLLDARRWPAHTKTLTRNREALNGSPAAY